MAAPESEQVIFIEEGDDEYSTDSGGSDLGYDSDLDPSYSPLEDTHATFSKLSIGKKSKSRIGKDLDVGVDEIEEKVIQKIIEAGQQEKLKVEQCKVYLRKNGLRLTGNKPTLIQRIKEHLEISNGGGERRYPIFSFVLDCKGDACTGDVVMFKQNVYKMFNIAACSASGPPCGKRIVAGRIVKESYGAAKQQHTFTIEVLWSKGEKPLPPLRPLLIKGRNLYRLKTLRQVCTELKFLLPIICGSLNINPALPILLLSEMGRRRGETQGFDGEALKGFYCKANREIRIHGKEKRKLLKANRMSINQVPKSCQCQMNLIVTEKVEILSQQQLALNMDSNQMKNGPQQLSVQPQNCIREAPINRQRLKSINHHPPTCPPQEQSCMKQQLCPYYPKGRCYFGDNCKFLHEHRDNGDQRPEYRFQMAAEPVNLNEFQELARLALPKMYYDFYAGGAEDEHTLKENVEAFHRITFRPRILVDVSRIDLSTTILDYKISAPIIIAPTALHKLANPEGEVATARAAASCNTIMVLSFTSSSSIEEVAASSNAVFKKRDITATLVQRAERNGFKALVLTADTPRLGRREADIKNKMITPPLKNLEGLLSTKVSSDTGSNFEADANETMDASLSWKDLEWLRSITNLPILIKGILTREDGKIKAPSDDMSIALFCFPCSLRLKEDSFPFIHSIKAVEVGVAGIIVSNHGARQLDYTPATISALEEVVHAVKGRVPILMDGGVRRGTDVFKALALGAQAVLIGRPVVYGLAAKGEYGVRRVIEMLKDEFELTMALTGCPSVKHITRKHSQLKSFYGLQRKF
ncbi:hypothetical protein WN944_021845 [Citrus x changshan-huyou]|uniref:(S)-2-hydroxy-acid oxidase n=1 Tax=Citrus x changshan-huyou TaxID=2935761 RepID=A0AAP0MXJ7_9ROSI